MNNFKAGDKVVFIGTLPHTDVRTGEIITDTDPRPNIIYLVIDQFQDEYGHFIVLAGIGEEGDGWSSYDFRKLVTRTELAAIEQEAKCP